MGQLAVGEGRGNKGRDGTMRGVAGQAAGEAWQDEQRAGRASGREKKQHKMEGGKHCCCLASDFFVITFRVLIIVHYIGSVCRVTLNLATPLLAARSS